MQLISSHKTLSLPVLKLVKPRQEITNKNSFFGLLSAVLIIGLWGVSLGYLLLNNITFWLIPIAILWQAFLYTGLFITAHDAMHGTAFPKNPKINRFLGAVSTFTYGLFSYQELLKKHWLHHHYPASASDPDFHDGQNKNPIAWYFHFMKGYFGWRQIIGFTLLYNLAKYYLHIPEIHLVLFWVLPSILSSVQLFYFGTFLTHREPEEGYINPHRAQSNSLPVFWSFIACYHFGYHEEHHEYPDVPWWQLPAIHQKSGTYSTPLSRSSLRTAISKEAA